MVTLSRWSFVTHVYFIVLLVVPIAPSATIAYRDSTITAPGLVSALEWWVVCNRIQLCTGYAAFLVICSICSYLCLMCYAQFPRSTLSNSWRSGEPVPWPVKTRSSLSSSFTMLLWVCVKMWTLRVISGVRSCWVRCSWLELDVFKVVLGKIHLVIGMMASKD